MSSDSLPANLSPMQSGASGIDRHPVPVNPVYQLLCAGDVLLELEAHSKTRVFEEVGRMLEKRGGFPQAGVAARLCEREDLGSTGLGHGVAIPHARIKGLCRAAAVYVRTRMPIDFAAPDGKPVSDMLILLVPEQATDEHLQLLAWAAQMFGDRGFRERIRTCVSEADLRQQFADWPKA